MSNTCPAAEEEYASSAFDSDNNEDASSGNEEEEMVGETQPAQQQPQPILTSPITDGRRYQLRSTPDRLASSQRGLQQQPRYPFVDAARVRGLGGARATALFFYLHLGALPRFVCVIGNG